MTDRYRAFAALLAQADPADLPARGHVLTCKGDPHRMERQMPGLLMRWLQRRILDQHEELPQPATTLLRWRASA